MVHISELFLAPLRIHESMVQMFTEQIHISQFKNPVGQKRKLLQQIPGILLVDCLTIFLQISLILFLQNFSELTQGLEILFTFGLKCINENTSCNQS